MAEGNSLGNALKYLRRHVYLHAHNWRALVIVKDAHQLDYAFNEIRNILEAGSLKVESVNREQGSIQLEKGAMVRFGVISRSDDKYKFAGSLWTQIMWMYTPEPQMREYIGATLRSATVPVEQLVDEKIDW